MKRCIKSEPNIFPKKSIIKSNSSEPKFSKGYEAAKQFKKKYPKAYEVLGQ